MCDSRKLVIQHGWSVCVWRDCESSRLWLTLTNPHYVALSFRRFRIVRIHSIAVNGYRGVVIVLRLLLVFRYCHFQLLYVHKMQISCHKLLTSNRDAVRAAFLPLFSPSINIRMKWPFIQPDATILVCAAITVRFQVIVLLWVSFNLTHAQSFFAALLPTSLTIISPLYALRAEKWPYMLLLKSDDLNKTQRETCRCLNT